MKKTIVAATLLLLSLPAFAQTSPGLKYNQVLTPGQWNQLFQSKQDVLGYIPLNTAGGILTGRLTTAPPGTNLAGFNLSPGTAPLAPIDGDLWVTTTGLYARINGATVGPIAVPTAGSFAASAPLTVSFPSGVVTYSLDLTHANTWSGQQTFVAPKLGTPASGVGTNLTGIPLGGLLAGTQDTVVGYYGSTAASAIAVPNCSVALTYSTSTHTWGCNSTAGTGNVIVSGTPTAGQFAQWTNSTTIQGISPAPIVNVLGADVPLNNTSNYFDGPSIAQGSTGTWWVAGTVSVSDTAGTAIIYCRLWDGTTIIAAGMAQTQGASGLASISLAGYLATPAANIKMSCKDISGTTGKILANQSGSTKDSTISAHRIQ